MMHRNLNISVKIAPPALIDALVKNKLCHQDDYAKAMSVWLEDLVRRGLEIADAAGAGNIDADYSVHLPKPIDNTKLYDKYIGMFSMATDDVVEISSEDYGCIVDDNWDWAVHATASNAMYSAKFRG